MCGITGFVDWQYHLLQEKWVLEKMTKTLEKRGPNDKGYFLIPMLPLVIHDLLLSIQMVEFSQKNLSILADPLSFIHGSAN